MDPNAAIRSAREALTIFRANYGEGEEHMNAALDSASDIADAFEALDDWLSKGGFAPSAWDGHVLACWTTDDAKALIGRDLTADETEKIRNGMGFSTMGDSFEALVESVAPAAVGTCRHCAGDIEWARDPEPNWTHTDSGYAECDGDGSTAEPEDAR